MEETLKKTDIDQPVVTDPGKNSEEIRKELAACNKDIEAFAASVSHDLRAPLRVISGYMQLLLKKYDGKFDEEGKELTNVILNNVKSMNKLIEDQLVFFRTARRPLQKTQVAMKDIAFEVCHQAKEDEEQEKGKKREIEFVIGELPDAEADADLMRIVWLNFISNAIKFTRKKEKAIIKIGFEEKNDKIIYSVSDNGVGLEMEYCKKLFSGFLRFHSQEEYEGNGIGLATVGRIVSRHGGSAWCESKLNEGATFYFTLGK